MKVLNKPLVDYNGQPIKIGNEELTVAKVLMHCTQAPTENNAPRSKVDIMMRYDHGLRFSKMALDEFTDVDIEFLSVLLNDMRRSFTVVVCGQMYTLLEEKH